NHVSTLAATDPELIDVFDNFAFDEVLEGSSLDVRIRLMVQLAAIIASHGLREYESCWLRHSTLGSRRSRRRRSSIKQSPTSASPRCSTSCTSRTTCSRNGEWHSRWPRKRGRRPRLAFKSVERSRGKSSGARLSTSCTPRLLPTSNTSSGF